MHRCRMKIIHFIYRDAIFETEDEILKFGLSNGSYRAVLSCARRIKSSTVSFQIEATETCCLGF